jgi:hypothetical protein
MTSSLRGRPKIRRLSDYSRSLKQVKKDDEAKEKLNILNPMQYYTHWYLQPLQDALARNFVLPMRGLKALFTWDDPFVTTWFYFGLCCLALIFALTPWSFLFYHGARLLGLAVFGPHMHWYGLQLEMATAERREAEKEFAAKSREEQKALVKEMRAKAIEKEARELLAAAVSKEPEDRRRALEKANYLKSCGARARRRPSSSPLRAPCSCAVTLPVTSARRRDRPRCARSLRALPNRGSAPLDRAVRAERGAHRLGRKR